MEIGLRFRAVASVCALCAAGVLALAPPAAAADPAPARPSAPGQQKATVPPPDLLEKGGTQVRLRAGAPALPEVSALSWLVADADTGEVLAAHDAHRRLPPASTLKTLFALTVLPAFPAGVRHTVSARELAGIGEGSSLVGVVEGHTYRVADLWYGVFLNSGNDAVRVLAALNGGWEHTARQMERKARSLGALDTTVVSPDGYDAEGQVSSAYDLAVFGRAGLRDPDFTRYCSTAYASFPGHDGTTYRIANTNRLLTGADGVEPYPGLLGIKNGYTSKAGNTLIAAARRGGRTLVVTVMNPQKGNGLTVYEEARKLLDWGFEAAGHVDPVGSLDALRPVSHAGAEASAAKSPTAPPSGPDRAVGSTVASALGVSAGTLLLGLAGVTARRYMRSRRDGDGTGGSDGPGLRTHGVHRPGG
ncbi:MULTISPECIES: D-alanyl-D-alanine carboxypeptidase family protein [Streptomyces]|uniref:D-alanyl-D-alanine carboxypeptidase family protein n=1 Tax=Streptomyces TaxID=1883 RepID=UPI0009A07EA1|nr:MULTISPECIES: serine hydrolase [Streptomyces]MDN5384628.1 D-alanyl-D-alanine carboxypeptidase [Streptomyces sp. LB8]